MPDTPPCIVYTDGLVEISREDFLELQYRIHCGDPVAWGHVILQMEKYRREQERRQETDHVAPTD